MRLRRHANTERLRSKELRLKEVLRRRDLALLLGMMPKGVLTAVSHTSAGTTTTIHAPLRALVATPQETWKVDFDMVPDPTGGFDDVVIPAGKQIGELATDQVVSFVGQPVGAYTVYAQHVLVDENPETREPPGKYAGGTGVFPEHRDFFGHGKPDGTPIPREGYDSTLTPEVVSEAVDRLTIAFAPKGSEPANATPLVEVIWNGTSIASSTVIARTLDLTTLYDHIGAGGNAHAVATASVDGFMSAADKSKLDGATSAPTANRLAQRDANGRIKVATPAAGAGGGDDAANRDYVDSKVAGIPEATTSTAGLMPASDKAKLNNATASATAGRLMLRDANGRAQVAYPGTNDNDIANKKYVDDAVAGLPSAIYWGRVAYGGISVVAPPGWTVSTQGVGRVRVTHNLGTASYGVALTPLSFAHAHVSTINANYFEVTTLTISITSSSDLLGTSDYAAFYYTVTVS